MLIRVVSVLVRSHMRRFRHCLSKVEAGCVSHIDVVAQLVVESLQLSGRALEREIRRFDVRLLMRTQGFFLCPTPETRRMNIFLQSLSNLIYPLFCVLLILFFVQEGVMLSGLISPCFFSFIGKFHCIIMIFAFFWLRSPRSSDFKLRP